jgi:hypothetical protein
MIHTTKMIIIHKTDRNVQLITRSYALSSIALFSTNNGPHDNKPWLNPGNRDLARIFNQRIQEKYNTKIGGGFPNIIKMVEEYIKSLEDGKLYSMLPVAVYRNEQGTIVYKTILKESVKVSNKFNYKALANSIYTSLILNLDIYDLKSVEQVILYYKVWVTENELKVSFKDACEILNKVFDRRLAEKRIINHEIGNTVEPSRVPKELNSLRKNPVTAPLFDSNLINYENFDITQVPTSSDYNLSVELVNDNCFNVSVKDSDNNELLNFIDRLNPSTKEIIREYKNLELVFKNGKLDHTKVRIRMDELKEMNGDLIFDDKIGTIDLETCPSREDPNLFTVYACAYAVEGKTQTYYLGDNGLLTGEELIVQMIKDIFNNRLMSNTFYVHNLGRFDGHFIIKTLLDAGFEVKPTIKEDKTIISLKICTFLEGVKGGKKKKVSFTILDSILMLKGSLDSLGKDFGASVLKGKFPHSFASMENLNYVGPTPSIEHYDSITPEEYSLLKTDKWSFRAEAIKYLINDVESLREILLKFATEVYDMFSINITKYKTLPSMALAIYLSNYYDRNKNPLKVVKGDVEKNIREAYYGGIASVFEHEVFEGYYMDVNSHYPRAMKNPMPIGDPVYTDKKDLEDIFGFVKAKIIAPNKSVLKNPILPVRTENGLECPSDTTFFGWWFSEELKNAKKFGYHIEVIGAWEFKKSNNLFDDFVDKLYNIKASAEADSSRRSTAKLLLNSLYGRMGMNEISNRVKIVPTAEVEGILKKLNWSEFINMGEFSMVRYTGVIDPELKKIIDVADDKLESASFTAKRRGIPSSVPIAAAVTSYARIAISEHFNNPNNKCFMTDTDSLVTEKPLDQELIGPELGQFKLEYKVDHGIFISPKTYALKYKDLKTGEFKYKFVAKGIGGEAMEWEDYEKLLTGQDIVKEKTYFEPLPGLGTVRIYTQPFTITGVKIENPTPLSSGLSPMGLNTGPVGGSSPLGLQSQGAGEGILSIAKASSIEIVESSCQEILEAEFSECNEIKLLPAPAKLLALPGSVDYASSANAEGPKDPEADSSIPEVIYLPAPLPKVIPVSAPSKENLIIELNSKIKELNEEISKLNAKIENILGI